MADSKRKAAEDGEGPATKRQRQGRFTGKTIVITGAGGNFGRAGSEYFAAEGANVVAVDLAEAALAETQKVVKEAGGSIITVTCDVTKESDVERIVSQAKASYGSIDLCWNNAGWVWFGLVWVDCQACHADSLIFRFASRPSHDMTPFAPSCYTPPDIRAKSSQRSNIVSTISAASWTSTWSACSRCLRPWAPP